MKDISSFHTSTLPASKLNFNDLSLEDVPTFEDVAVPIAFLYGAYNNYMKKGHAGSSSRAASWTHKTVRRMKRRRKT